MSTARTTELRADCSAGTDGRITFRLRLPQAEAGAAHPRLLLVLRPKKGRPEEASHVLGLEPGGDHLRAVLEPRPVLAEGRWDAYLLRGPDAGRERLRPGLRDLRLLVDGGARQWTSPVAVRVPYATKDGFLALRAWRRTAHAEAGPIDIADGAMTVRARLHGAELSGDAAVRLRLRGGGTEREYRPRPAGDGDFSFTVDYAELAEGTPGSRVWDAFLRPAAGAPPVRIGRLFDDVADRKGVYVYPRVTVGGAAVRPYYTVDNDLAVEVTAAG
ncbi:transferase [Streptomyces sp. Tu 3180]|uniref:transferase n=1 Tax=Streptomyces sp. Tu 3180 TaxID=2682611 RepID=UPI00135CCE84|nr:transferase [Streptomyces sp. Tu 3180]KAF3463647.1 transferase [Streptomyces sp. Tu 3180]